MSRFFQILCLCLGVICRLGWADTKVLYTPVEDPSDQRLVYPLAVLDLALHKTEAKYGPYHFEPIPGAISIARSVHELNLDTYPNYFFPSGAHVVNLQNSNLLAVDFPLDHGLLSYRICFVSPQAKEAVAKVTSLDELKKFSIGQGVDWPDIAILQANGFKVKQVTNYVSLFKMVLGNRIDLFCRGIAELHKEYDAYNPLGQLQYDESFALVYPMSFSFYFNKNSKRLVRRIEEGLAIAQKDGSLKTLFLKHHADDIRFAKLKNRRLFYLTPLQESHQSAVFKSYIVDPLKID